MEYWSLRFSVDAERDLAKLDLTTRRRIIKRLDWFLDHLDSLIPSALTGEFREFYKFRVGDWRVIYKIHWKHKVIIVHYITNRDKVYKQKH